MHKILLFKYYHIYYNSGCTEASNNNGRMLSRDQINLSLPYRSFISNVFGWTELDFRKPSRTHTPKTYCCAFGRILFYFIVVRIYTLDCYINLWDVYGNWAAFELLYACIILDYIGSRACRQKMHKQKDTLREKCAWPDYVPYYTCIRFGQLVLYILHP